MDAVYCTLAFKFLVTDCRDWIRKPDESIIIKFYGRDYIRCMSFVDKYAKLSKLKVNHNNESMMKR